MDVKKFLNIHKSFIILIVILFVTEFVFALFSIIASRNSEWAVLEHNAENIKMHCKCDIRRHITTRAQHQLGIVVQK